MERDNQQLSIRKQCEILSLNRSSLYYEWVGVSEEDQRILDEMDKIYLDFPIYGSRRMSRDFTSIPQEKKIKISMDGKGRVIDNVFIERFWRAFKYEEVYTKCYETIAECRASIGEFIRKYNQERLHQSLGEYDTPFEAYRQMQMVAAC